jgi:hypothetical protein
VTGYRVAAGHAGVDALVATGAAHRASVPRMTQLILNSPPVRRNPAFDVRDPLYVSTRADWRSWFYNAANTDPEVIATDERLKQTAGALEIPSALPYLVNGVSRTTNIPVLGDRDPLFAHAADCSSDAALAAFERRFYGRWATVEAMVVGGAGHMLNLERTAPATFDRMLEFCDRHVGVLPTA